jgi:hypothetical protein
MIKKLIIIGLILVVAYLFYKKYVASELEGFFQQKQGKVVF